MRFALEKKITIEELRKLDDFNKIKYLNFYNIELTESDILLISKCKNIRRLYLNNVGLTEFPKLFLNLKYINILSLNNNEIKTLPNEFENFKHLTGFDINNNNLENFPACILNLPELQGFSCSYNSIKKIPEEVLDIKKLISITCLGESLISVPEILFSSGKFKDLKFSSKFINGKKPKVHKIIYYKEEIHSHSNPEEILKIDLSFTSLNLQDLEYIAKCTNLEFLKITNTRFEAKYNFLENLKKLKYLNVIGYSDSNYWNSIGELKELENITIRTNAIPFLGFSKSTNRYRKSKEINVIDEIKDFPYQILKLIKLKKLVLNGRELTSIPKEINKLENLEVLVIAETNIETLPTLSLPNLKELKMSNNLKIKDLGDSFSNLRNLEKLSIFSYKNSITLGDVSKLVNLKHLRIIGTDLEEFPNISRATKLEVLDLSSNKFKEVPEYFDQLNCLKKITLNSNPITKIPKEIFSSEQLEEVDLYDNKLEKLPEFTPNSKKLKELDFSRNQLQELPDGVFLFENLEEIYLDNNKIKKLPETISQAKKLIGFQAEHNEIKILPDSFFELKNLEDINISYNKIKKLPETISQAKKLIDFQAEHNEIKTLPDSFFELKSLEEINVSYNKIEKLPDIILPNNNLKKLELFNNKLKSLPKSFVNLFELEELDLEDNLLEAFPEEILKLENLNSLEINNNKIENLPEKIGPFKKNTEHTYIRK
ncbi:leucine-rich repeat domain-containing protein [Aureivirga sp. CE67]|uniref:leucine-rich repeat domain-containing protein n=1 Tax=Aureivirga sp. CE67 TaxID=1788983 RepID=UPI0018C9BCF1|nr:leucine-rich repeat domain-containing protein [Aureivirga sp. CE67]